MGQAGSITPRAVDLKTLLNIILIIFIIVAGFFGYYYLRKQAPDFVNASIPVKTSVPPHFLFNFGDRLNQPGSLNKPLAVDVDDNGRIFVADTGNADIKVFNASGRYQYSLDKIKKGPAIQGSAGLAVWQDRVYVTDGNNFRVLEYNTKGNFVKTFINKDLGKKVGAFVPAGIAVNQDGDVYITDVFYQRVLVFDRSGKFKFQFGSPGSTSGKFQYANDLAVGKNGNVYVSDSNNSRVQVFDPKGHFLYLLGSSGTAKADMALPRGIVADKNDRIFVVDTFGHKVQVFDAQDKGNLLFTFGDKGTDNGQFDYPNGIAIKGNRFFITDRENNRISVFSY